jgi:hypothetical protein
MTYSDYSPLLLAAQKHLKNAEAALALHDWNGAGIACTDANDQLWQLAQWIDRQLGQGYMQGQSKLPIDSPSDLGGQS